RVELGRSQVQDALFSVSGSAAGLFNQERNRIRFVNEEMSASDVAAALVCRVKKNAAARKNAECFCDEGSDPAHVVVLGQWSFESCNAVVDVSANGISPMTIIGGIDRVFRRVLWN